MRCIVGLLLVALLLAPAASAHANYLSSEPRRGTRLVEAPGEVTVTLSEPVDADGVSLVVRDQDGRRVDNDDLRVEAGDTPRLRVTLADEAGPGAYTATWKALSTVDGHVTTGAFGFAVGAFDPPTPAATEEPVPVLSALARAVLYVGFALGFGGLAALRLVEPDPRRPGRTPILSRAVVVGAFLQLAGVSALFGYTLRDAGLGLGDFGSTAVGQMLALRVGLALLGVAVAILLSRGHFGRPWQAGAMGLLFLAGAWGSSNLGHASLRGVWGVVLDWFHLVAAATWLGGLALFLHYVATAYSRGDTMESVRVTGLRFSKVALASVTVLGLTGLAAAFLILGSHPFRDPLAVFGHPFGRFLGAKVLLFAGMLALAGVNRFVFLGERPGPDTEAPGYGPEVTAPAETRGAHARTYQFARVVTVEAGLGVAVIVLAGFLTAISPPTGAGVDADADAFTAFGASDHYDVLLAAVPAPAAGSASNVTFTIRTADGAPLTEAVRVRVEVRAEGQPGSNYTANHEGDGVWRTGDVFFAAGGAHVALVTIQTEEIFRDVVEVRFDVAS